MNNQSIARFALCFVVLTFLAVTSSAQRVLPHTNPIRENADFQPDVPGGFTENKGQFVNDRGETIPSVYFRLSSKGTDVYLRDSGLTFVFTKRSPLNSTASPSHSNTQIKCEWTRIDLLFGTLINKEQIIKGNPSSQGYSNHYHTHCPNGVLNVSEYGQLTVTDLYPGIDLMLSAEPDAGIKYDFVVHPGADASVISIEYKGVSEITSPADGKTLMVKCALGELNEGKLLTYQDAKNNEINSSFSIAGNTVRYQLGEYDHAKKLIIDPPLTWATYYGGDADDFCFDITTDAQGNVFVTGTATASNFPCQDPGSGAYYQGTGIYSMHWISDAFVLKFNNQGVRQWATYYGGDGAEIGYGIKVDANGNVYVVGSAEGLNMPVFDQGGGAYYQATCAGGSSLGTELNLGDAFILKFTNAGVRLWATYFGGSGADGAMNLDIDAAGNIFITGIAASTNFPVVDPGGGAWYQSTGGSSYDIFISRFTPAGILSWSTYYGGSLNDMAYGIYIDANDDVYVTGSSGSTNFPTLNSGSPAYFQGALSGGLNSDIVVLRFSDSGVREWATYYGGNKEEEGQNICVDLNGNIYVVGLTTSTDLPTLDPGGGAFYQGTYGGAAVWDGGDVFILKFGPQNEQLWATYYGGADGENDPNNEAFVSASSVATDASGNVYVTASTVSSGFPTYNPGGSYYYLGTYQGGLTDGGDIVIMRFNSLGQREWSTFYGGTNDDFSEACTLDLTNNCYYVTGYTLSGSGWGGPSTNLFTVDPGGGAYIQNTNASFKKNGYILKFCDSCTVPSVQVADGEICGAGSITLNAQNSGSSFLWSTGDTAQIITVTTPGLYWVQVTADGCSATDYFEIVDMGLNSGDDLNIPNVFTPDGDGTNDGYGMSGSFGDLYELWIYDRWGTLVFYSNEQAHLWDGIYNKEMATTGVYYYIFDYNLQCQSPEIVYKSTGFLQLIRN